MLGPIVALFALLIALAVNANLFKENTANSALQNTPQSISTTLKRCYVSEYAWNLISVDEVCESGSDEYNYTPPPSNNPTQKPAKKVTTTTSVPSISDPPVHCNIAKECGGGTTPLKKSECDNSTCCQLSDGSWRIYKDRSQCDKDQDKDKKPVVPSNISNKQDKVIVYLGGFSYSCEPSAENAIKDAYSEYGKQVDSAREQSKICTYGTTEDINKCVESFYSALPIYQQAYENLITKYCP